MLPRFRSWIRIVFAPDWPIWAGLTGVTVLWLIEWSIRPVALWISHNYWPTLTEQELGIPEVTPLHQGALVIFALGYGALRGWRFHPVFSEGHGTWLTQTPWDLTKPLPCGPVHLVWQDGAVLVTILALSLLPPYFEIPPIYLPFAFLVSYSGVLIFSLISLKMLLQIPAWVLLVGIAILCYDSPFALIAIACAMYVVTYVLQWQSLVSFPYSEEKRESLGLTIGQPPPTPPLNFPILPTKLSAWPLRLSSAMAAISAGVFGVVMYCMFFHFQTEPDFAKWLLYVHGLAVTIAIVARLLIYCANSRSPISFLGRLATGRVLIPGYDIVYLGPLLTGLFAYALPVLLLSYGIGPLVAVPLSTAVCLWSAVVLPPSYVTWHYTGQFRIATTSASGSKSIQTK